MGRAMGHSKRWGSFGPFIAVPTAIQTPREGTMCLERARAFSGLRLVVAVGEFR